jgi:hypothetical protein
MDPEEAIYRQGLSRNWMLRYGQRPDSLSRLSALADACVLVAAAGALALCLVRSMPRMLDVAIGIVVFGLIVSHAMNRYFVKLEKRAFVDIEQDSAGSATRHPSHVSPFYSLAKMATKPRVRAKHAWVEKRTKAFLRRRAIKQRQAEIFQKQGIKLGSIHGTAGVGREDSQSATARPRSGG